MSDASACVGIPPAQPRLPGFTQSRDRAVLDEDRKAALRANVLFQSGTQGARRRGPVRRYRGADPAAMSLRVNKEPVLNRLSNVAPASNAAPRRTSVEKVVLRRKK